MSDKVLVTGATGTLGKAVVEAVRNAGYSVLQGVRDVAKVNPQAEAVRLDFSEQSTIAAVVALALKNLLTGTEIDLTGPEALDHVEVAEIISRASGRKIEYHSLTEEQMLDGARSHGMPEPVAAYLGVLYSVVRAGHAAGVAPTPASLSGYQPRSFQTFAGQTDWNA